MVKRIVVLSGKVCSGKTTLANLLTECFGAQIFRTKEYLKEIDPKTELARDAMQILGEKLDIKTRGGWVCEGLRKFIMSEEASDNNIIIVDAVRIRNQIAAIRRGYRDQVVHIHLDAPYNELAQRYKRKRPNDLKELGSYRKVQMNPTESKVEELKKIADVVIDTKRCTEDDIKIKAASYLGLYGRENLRLVDVLVGGQYGSEGKGNISAYLAREYDILIRVGGPNAGHKVYAEPEPHNFHHLPSGCLTAPYAKILIGPGATIYAPDLVAEINKYGISYKRIFVDPQAMIISKKDKSDEGALVSTIGSTGQGVGAANARRIRHRKPGKVKLAKDCRDLRNLIKNTCEVLERAFNQGKKIFLEGTQGTALSLYHGHYPHVTSRDTTVAGCLAEAGISPSRTRKIIMVCRTYPIRVESPKRGDSGPMGREITWHEVAKRSGYKSEVLMRNEHTSTTYRLRRVGEFEWTWLRKAASLNAPTDIALTFVDYIRKKNENARRFEQLNEETIRFIQEVERVAAAPVSLISTRFDYRNIIDRRAW